MTACKPPARTLFFICHCLCQLLPWQVPDVCQTYDSWAHLINTVNKRLMHFLLNYKSDIYSPYLVTGSLASLYPKCTSYSSLWNLNTCFSLKPNSNSEIYVILQQINETTLPSCFIVTASFLLFGNKWAECVVL